MKWHEEIHQKLTAVMAQLDALVAAKLPEHGLASHEMSKVLVSPSHAGS